MCRLPVARGGENRGRHGQLSMRNAITYIWREQKIWIFVAIAFLAAAGVVAYLMVKRPEDVSNPDAVFVEEGSTKEVIGLVDWPFYGRDIGRTRYMNVQQLEPPLKVAWQFKGRNLLEYSPDPRRRLALRRQQQRHRLLDQDAVGQGPLAPRHRLAQRLLSGLQRRPALHRQPRAGAGAVAERQERSHPVAPGSAGAQRVLARRRRREGAGRMRVRNAVRVRRGDREDAVGDGPAGSDQGGAGGEGRHRLHRRLQRHDERRERGHRRHQVADRIAGRQLRPGRRLLRHRGGRVRPRLRGQQGRPHVQLRAGFRRPGVEPHRRRRGLRRPGRGRHPEDRADHLLRRLRRQHVLRTRRKGRLRALVLGFGRLGDRSGQPDRRDRLRREHRHDRDLRLQRRERREGLRLPRRRLQPDHRRRQADLPDRVRADLLDEAGQPGAGPGAGPKKAKGAGQAKKGAKGKKAKKGRKKAGGKKKRGNKKKKR